MVSCIRPYRIKATIIKTQVPFGTWVAGCSKQRGLASAWYRRGHQGLTNRWYRIGSPINYR